MAYEPRCTFYISDYQIKNKIGVIVCPKPNPVSLFFFLFDVLQKVALKSVIPLSSCCPKEKAEMKKKTSGKKEIFWD